MKVLWVSRHKLSTAQLRAIKDLHGEDVEIVKDRAVFLDSIGFVDYIYKHPDCFVYVAAGMANSITAAMIDLPFGIFENHPEKRQDGTFGLAAVYHVNHWTRPISKVWGNPDPTSDHGEALIPVLR